jgi:hypothetical protein
MKHLIYTLALFISTLAFGQNRVMHIPTHVQRDTTLWYQWNKRLGLEPIAYSNHPRHFRLWTNKQSIDVWEDSTGRTSGTLTSWTHEYTSSDEEPTNRIFFEKRRLDSIQVSALLSLLQSTQIDTIPDQYSIRGWQRGFDGITYILENTTPTNYYFKTYRTPRAQGSLEEAILVQDVVNSMLAIVHAEEIWTAFAARIPYECYINGGPTITCKALTQKERRTFEKERENYRKQ